MMMAIAVMLAVAVQVVTAVSPSISCSLTPCPIRISPSFGSRRLSMLSRPSIILQRSYQPIHAVCCQQIPPQTSSLQTCVSSYDEIRDSISASNSVVIASNSHASITAERLDADPNSGTICMKLNFEGPLISCTDLYNDSIHLLQQCGYSNAVVSIDVHDKDSADFLTNLGFAPGAVLVGDVQLWTRALAREPRQDDALFRPATHDDAELICDLMRSAFDSVPTAEGLRTQMRDFSLPWIMSADNSGVAFATTIWGADRIVACHVCTTADDSILAIELLSRLVDDLLALGYAGVIAQIPGDNDALKSAYEALAFKDAGAMEYGWSSTWKTCRLMKRRLCGNDDNDDFYRMGFWTTRVS